MHRGHHHSINLVAASAAATILVGAASALDVVDGAAPRRVKLLPMGRIAMRDGRGPYYLRDRAHAERVVAATREYLGTADFMFDYDHQALAAAKQDGQTARASGWAKSENLTVEADGIYANEIDWTPAGAAAIEAREYRYVSPTFFAAKANGDVLQLKNTALVNMGAIDLPAIAAGATQEDNSMDKAALLALLGLAADASDEVIAAAVITMKGAVAASTSTIAVAAGLAATAGVEEIAAAVTGLKAAAPDPGKFVPIEQVAAMNTRLSTLEGERAEQVVASAIASGKLVPSLKGWATDYFRKDETGFNTWLTNQPAIVGAGSVLDGDRLTTDGLTAEEVAAAAVIGMSEADMLAAKKEDAANGAR
ncbi:MAG TPA: phage protease [Sphingobium sp.]